MIIIHTAESLNNHLKDKRCTNKIGFVPTMGALHDGHCQLIKESTKNNNTTIVSIFVNPTQFNNKEDFKFYPRTVEKDCLILESLNVDYAFIPSVEEMYPKEDNRIFDFGNIDKVMEGRFRPGHFNGVAQIVSKLFEIVKPNRAYFGEKDIQQVAIIKSMVLKYNIPVKIITVPIIRENNGLAMSSRNTRLSKEDKENASFIYKTLKESISEKNSIEETKTFVISNINNTKNLELEYFSIVDGENMQPIDNWESANTIYGCIAVYCAGVRLIDNIRYK